MMIFKGTCLKAVTIFLALIQADAYESTSRNIPCCNKKGASYLAIALDMLIKEKGNFPISLIQSNGYESTRKNILCCNKKDTSYLDIALEMLIKAKENYATCQNDESMHVPIDCEEWLLRGHNKSQVYQIWLQQNRVTSGKLIDVYCDMETDGGGWTVIQRRGNFSNPEDYFFQDWQAYKEGFGNLEEEFWLGNDNIYAITSQKLYSVRFDLTAVSGKTAYALYDNFWIYDESLKYTLHLSNYRGTAGDAMTSTHNGMKFSTKDEDNDENTDSCSALFKGAWWYKKCYSSNLNGFYLQEKRNQTSGVHWSTFRGKNESLYATEIKLRSRNFKNIYAKALKEMQNH